MHNAMLHTHNGYTLDPGAKLDFDFVWCWRVNVSASWLSASGESVCRRVVK